MRANKPTRRGANKNSTLWCERIMRGAVDGGCVAPSAKPPNPLDEYTARGGGDPPAEQREPRCQRRRGGSPKAPSFFCGRLFAPPIPSPYRDTPAPIRLWLTAVTVPRRARWHNAGRVGARRRAKRARSRPTPSHRPRDERRPRGSRHRKTTVAPATRKAGATCCENKRIRSVGSPIPGKRRRESFDSGTGRTARRGARKTDPGES